jgi:hypothetical protein
MTANLQVLKQWQDFAKENNLCRKTQKHRDIYLTDARRVSVDKLKTNIAICG